MNIFFLDKCPSKAAKSVVDKHTVKMIVESSQMLANCYSLDRLAGSDCPRTQKGTPRKYSYVHHPCSIWVKKSLSNFNWLLEHAIYLYEEKINRIGGDHYCIGFLKWCFENTPDIIDIGLTEPALAFKNYPHFQDRKDPVSSYHKFYVADKQYDDSGKYMAYYTNRRPPSFWFDLLNGDQLEKFKISNGIS